MLQAYVSLQEAWPCKVILIYSKAPEGGKFCEWYIQWGLYLRQPGSGCLWLLHLHLQGFGLGRGTNFPGLLPPPVSSAPPSQKPEMLLLPLQCGTHRHVPLAPGLLQTTKPCFYQSPCPVQVSFSIQSREACEQLLSAQDASPLMASSIPTMPPVEERRQGHKAN